MVEEKLSENKIYYDKRFGTLSQQLNEEEQIRWNAISNVLQNLRLEKNIHIADFGCGRGWLSQKLSHFGNVTGFDLSEKAIENARQNFPDLKFVCLNAAGTIPEEFKTQFDLVVSSEVIEHIDQQQSYISNLAQLLKKGGNFLLSTPNGKWFDKFYQDGREAWKQPLENWVEIDTLENLLSTCGLKTKTAITFNSEWIFQFQPKISIAWISKVLVRRTIKAFGLYNWTLERLNKKQFGLNILLTGVKTND